VKQGIRLLAKPGAFFNQMQWSTHHWVILTTYLGFAWAETTAGRHLPLYRMVAQFLERTFGLSEDVSLWIVIAAKLSLLAAGTVGITTLVWFIGTLFGRSTSQRVLFRRLAIVFSVFLAGYTAHHLGNVYPMMAFASLTLFLWGLLLGYFAIREQFSLTHLESVVVGVFAMLVVVTGWHFSVQTLERTVHDEIAGKSKPVMVR